MLAAGCTAVDCLSLVTLLIALSLLTIPTVFHMLINGRIACLKFTQSSDCVGDQSLSRSPNSFPGSCATWSRDVRGTERSYDWSGDLVT
jgi:hypothetical protein